MRHNGLGGHLNPWEIHCPLPESQGHILLKAQHLSVSGEMAQRRRVLAMQTGGPEFESPALVKDLGSASPVQEDCWGVLAVSQALYSARERVWGGDK